MSKLNTPEDALPLLAYKIAPRQFDISYRFSNISLRDQIVRAQMLVRTLLETGLVRAKSDGERGDFQLLICGAGAAGLAAAKEADAHNISFVLVEKGRSVPGGVLRSKATRYVSTAMYEWPHPNHGAAP
ncbi:NAD(P)-binding protein [Burkholderia pseudomallei]|uniref:NAD(P)-binding protein n=1 Tax=Burkholderia pseudomallei TaxID=28450 RepID=UPI0012FE2019|nr:NAD(P)-binding protein [Burkholderia pseudomallei]